MLVPFGQAADTIKGFLSGKGYDGEDRAALSQDSQLIGTLEEKFKAARDDRRQYEREWQINLAFLKGQQWLEWDKVRQTLYLPPVPPWRVRLTTNLIQPMFRTIFGKITAQQAQAKVQATNDTTDSQQNARAQDELLEYLHVKCDSEVEINEVLKWAIVTGTGIHKVCWDKSLGDELPPDPETGQPQLDASGNPLHMGEIAHYSVSPFEFFPEPLAKKIEDMEYVFHVKVRPSSYIFRKYGVKIEDETITADDYLQSQFSPVGEEQATGTPVKGVALKEYWERPNSEQPEGRYVVYVNDTVLYQGPNPYPKEPIPFFEARESVVPDRFWGRSVISDLVPVQQNYNKNRSQAVEIRNSTARPKWAVVRGALDPGQTISTAPAEVIQYNPVPGAYEMGKPAKIEGGNIPVSFFQELERTQSELFEVAGIHDFSRGLSGLGGIRAGFALQMILEEDTTRIGILKRSADLAIMKVARAKLRLAKQFYLEPRTITIVGPDMAAEAKVFEADKIPDDVDVRIIASGALPASMAAKQQFVLQLWSQKLIQDPRVALKLLQLGDVEGVYDDVNRDTKQAQRENEAMKAGNIVRAHDYDNHLIHGQEHDAERKGEEYEQLVAQNPQIEQLFQQHVQMHRALIQQAMQPPPVQSPVKSSTYTQPGVTPVINVANPIDLSSRSTQVQTPQELGAEQRLSLGQ